MLSILHCFVLLLLFIGDGVWLWRCGMVLRAISSLAVVLLKGGDLLYLCFCCVVRVLSHVLTLQGNNSRVYGEDLADIIYTIPHPGGLGYCLF